MSTQSSTFHSTAHRKTKRRNTPAYLLHLCCRTLKKLDISFPQDFLVFPQGALSMFFTGKQNKRVAGGTSIWVANKQDAVLSPADGTRLFKFILWREEGEHLLVRGGEREASHPHYDLVLAGQEHCYLMRCTWHRENDTGKPVQLVLVGLLLLLQLIRVMLNLTFQASVILSNRLNLSSVCTINFSFM